eukprot:Gb_28569 [translate_table: standard]
MSSYRPKFAYANEGSSPLQSGDPSASTSTEASLPEKKDKLSKQSIRVIEEVQRHLPASKGKRPSRYRKVTPQANLAYLAEIGDMVEPSSVELVVKDHRWVQAMSEKMDELEGGARNPCDSRRAWKLYWCASTLQWVPIDCVVYVLNGEASIALQCLKDEEMAGRQRPLFVLFCSFFHGVFVSTRRRFKAALETKRRDLQSSHLTCSEGEESRADSYALHAAVHRQTRPWQEKMQRCNMLCAKSVRWLSVTGCLILCHGKLSERLEYGLKFQDHGVLFSPLSY